VYQSFAQEDMIENKVRKLQRRWERNQRKQNKVNTLQIIPAVSYTPETSLGVGAVGMYKFKLDRSDSAMAYSNISPIALYTFNRQLILSARYQVLSVENYVFRGEIGYWLFPYFFWGIGNNPPSNRKEEYSASFPRFFLSAYRKWKPNLYAGIKYEFQNTNITKTDPDGQLSGGKVPGSGGSIQSGIGLGANYDSRDHVLSAHEGWFVDVGFVGMGSATGSSYTDVKWTIDARKYFKVNAQYVLAFQGIYEGHTGTPPFNLTAQLGGNEIMRGYQRGVYRDNNLMAIQGEYRSPVFYKYFAAAVFGSIGGVGQDFGDITRHLKWTTGGGLRFSTRPQDRFFLRVDVGFGPDTFGFYFALGEAF
jgi:hypothetical protein